MDKLNASRPVKKSFVIPSAKPNDVEYRLRRARETAQQTLMFLQSVSPEALPEGMLAALVDGARFLEDGIDTAYALAPAKKSRKKAGLPPAKGDRPWTARQVHGSTGSSPAPGRRRLAAGRTTRRTPRTA